MSRARQISEFLPPYYQFLRILTNLEIFGAEKRLKLVEITNKLIKINGFKNISFTQMNMSDLNCTRRGEWSQFIILKMVMYMMWIEESI